MFIELLITDDPKLNPVDDAVSHTTRLDSTRLACNLQLIKVKTLTMITKCELASKCANYRIDVRIYCDLASPTGQLANALAN